MKTKPTGWGYYTPEKVRIACTGGAMRQREDGDWEPAKPEPYPSFRERLCYAWDVLTYKADPLYWYFEKGIKRK